MTLPNVPRFTDADLKQLKDGMSTLRMTIDVSEYSLGTDELEALLARLEFAEAALEVVHPKDSCRELCCTSDYYQRWRTISGKEEGK